MKNEEENEWKKATEWKELIKPIFTWSLLMTQYIYKYTRS